MAGECTPEEYSQANSGDEAIYCLSRGEAIGSAIRVETGVISLLAVLVVFVLIVRNVVRHRRYGGSVKDLVSTPADIYLLALFTFDLIQSVGRTMDVRWVARGKVYTGSYCNVAGGIQQVGETGSAQITLAIAVHSFITIWFRRGKDARVVAFFVVALAALYGPLFVGIGTAVHEGTGHPFDAPNTLWCWIGPEESRFLAEWLTGEYLWIWLALLVSFAVYVPEWLIQRGMLNVDDERPWRFSFDRRSSPDAPHEQPTLPIIAYPLVYALSTLPITVGRWYGLAQFTGSHQVPPAVTLTVSCLFGLTGLFNVLLLLARPGVLLFGSGPGHAQEQSDEMPMRQMPRRSHVLPQPGEDELEDQDSPKP